MPAKPIQVNFFRTMISRALTTFFIVMLAALITACDGVGPSDQAIQKLGVLRVAVAKNSHVYFSLDQSMGFELDLVKRYAEKLNVKLAPTYVSSIEEVKTLLAQRSVHIGLGMIPVTGKLDELSFGPTITTTDLIIVTHRDAPKVSATTDLRELSTVVADPNLAATPFTSPAQSDFQPTVISHSNADSLLALVDQDAFDAAVITEADFQLLKHKYPYLKKRFVLREAVPVAWMMAKPTSNKLQQSLAEFFIESSNSGFLAKRWEFHYEYLEGFDFVDARKFLRRYSSELPKYRAEFEQAAAEHGFDWRLLAALSYQESHWDPNAKSPTGVKGLMMLTRNTAKELGVSRLDPSESIHGGTRYLANLQSRLEDEIAHEEQPLMALAAYNVGFGHLRDAQRVARRMNKNSSKWRIVKAHLPLLNKEKYAKQTRYGRARGGQAVHYVEGVRRYFSMIRLLEPEERVVSEKTPAPRHPTNLSALF
ncbi:MAG: membrane-bound lytic murein transglycosylase MltF [Gammaproteobacteria bacterium]